MKCTAARKEDSVLQTSCFCRVPKGPKLSLTERGQIRTRWGQTPGLGYGWADQENFGTAVPNLARVRGERREPPRGRRHWAAASRPVNRPDALAKQLPPRSTRLSLPPKGHHRSRKSCRRSAPSAGFVRRGRQNLPPRSRASPQFCHPPWHAVPA